MKSQADSGKTPLSVGRIRLSSAVVVAVIGMIGTVVGAYIISQANQAAILIQVQATQTAEARLTSVASSATSTPSPTSTSTPTSSPAPTSTLVPTSTPVPTSIPTSTPLCERNGHGGTVTIQVQPQRIIKGIHIDLRGRRTFGGNLFGFSLWEVEIYGPSTGNLARDKGVTAIAYSEQDDINCSQCLASAAIDGDMNTRWSSDFHEPQWLEITLSTPQAVNRIVLQWEEAYARDYCITLIE